MQQEASINMDLTQRVTVDTGALDWLGSPSDGVLRKPLEREAAESGRTTSVVKFLPGASFSPHLHPMGEEIFVLDGVFSDERGDYPKGSYIRNPPGSKHAPFSKEGCTLLVKLDQFDAQDDEQLVIDTLRQAWLLGHGNLQVMPLHSFGTTHTALVKWPQGEKFIPHTHFGGEEIFVLNGEFIDEHGRYSAGCWLRSPHLSHHLPYVEQDTLIFVKTGHL